MATTTLAGVDHWWSFTFSLSDPLPRSLTLDLLLHGFWFSGTVLTILACHEFGHYFACRYYDVDASLPFFIPVPLLMTGTMGAFIRIREPIPQKRMLFDIGIAGPIAGFAVAVPLLFVGVALSRIAPNYNPADLPPGVISYSLGEPLLFKLASALFWGTPPEGYSLNMHPVAFGAWFGLLATALNLFPIGQLDGGHISYAVLGRRSLWVTLAMVGVAVGLAYFYMSWWVWTVLMLLMLLVFGPRHPRVFDEEVPLDRPRLALALFAVAMFILCFTPAPITVTDLIRR
jgi:membrane-associated protease RseP (regulator of RpoE activity)